MALREFKKNSADTDELLRVQGRCLWRTLEGADVLIAFATKMLETRHASDARKALRTYKNIVNSATFKGVDTSGLEVD